MSANSKLSHKEHIRIHRDHRSAAKAASLRYVTDAKPGITRIKKGKGFSYYFDNSIIKDEDQLLRIKKLAIPPAWTRVWICPHANGHIQATGYDARNRKQYRYHEDWHSLRNETKFHRMIEFGKALPFLRKKIENDLAKKDLSEEKVLATVVSLMERTCIRVGNEAYEKEYGSYGLTTLHSRHVQVNGDRLNFAFRGKKGVFQKLNLKNRRLARIVAACRELPGRELFQYLDVSGERCSIDSGSVNEYIRDGMKGDFSAKDFRTWAGSLHTLRFLKSVNEENSPAEGRKRIIDAIDRVSRLLGNSRNICRKYYIHPGLFKLFEEGKLQSRSKITAPVKNNPGPGLTKDEKELMRVLKALR